MSSIIDTLEATVQGMTPSEVWEIVTDPTELRCKAIRTRREYEPGEFCSVWVARELDGATASCIVTLRNLAPEVVALLREAVEVVQEAKAWMRHGNGTPSSRGAKCETGTEAVEYASAWLAKVTTPGTNEPTEHAP